MNEKIGGSHLERKAVLYVRQSSLHQVAHNQESRRLQYAMKDRLQQLGWTEIEVIDDDQGRSASGAAVREGFQRMVAEVSLGRVGAVAAREVSRFARNSREWQQLIEVCRIVDTLLIDQESIYDPRRSNDRLLLGLKGSLNEYELDLLRHRGLEARREKAQRGELFVIAPIGYLVDRDVLVKDPDQRVQQAIHLMFEKFLELRTVRQVLFWFLENQLQVPVRRCVNERWETQWRRPNYGNIYRTLTHPNYGGAYVYGQSEQVTRWDNGLPKHHTLTRPRGQASVLIPNRHEGYVAWEDFQRIQTMIAGNNAKSPGGAVRSGASLLAGLLRCRRCGRKLTVRYTGREHDALRYCCFRALQDNGEPRCIHFGGASVDAAIQAQLLEVLRPAAIEAATTMARSEHAQKAQVLEALELECRSARYEADRARAQFDAVDPANRLVADELERRWNRALERVQGLEGKLEKERVVSPGSPVPSVDELMGLGSEVDLLWHHAETDFRLKKRIVRSLIEEILVDVDSEAGLVQLVIHWKGGVHSELAVARRKRGDNRRHLSPNTAEAIGVLACVLSDTMIAGCLNREGLRTGSGNYWTKSAVASARNHRGIPRHTPERQETEGWMSLNQAARLVGVAPKTLRRAAERCDLPSLHPLGEGPWIFRRVDLESAAARDIVAKAKRRDRRGSGPGPGQLPLGLPTTWRGEAL
ncbi:MAG: recombinase family protein [Verrucomicrobiales bacterium]|nr:recombinase family protein [Verrucomicrobiales bacterium]